jgi:thiamine biosynthesis lipoprotein ApbE
MKEYSFEIIGTHLHVGIDTSENCEELFRIIELRLQNFEKKFSRFIPGNWLDTLNRERKGELDEDGRIMLSTALEVARTTDGYFDPTIGSRLSSLGYGRVEDANHEIGYKNIILEGNLVTLNGDVILEFGGVGK